MDLSMRNLSMFQTTTFKNGVRFVFINLWGNYKALRQALENVINSKDKRFSSDGRSKAAGEEAVRHTIDSWIFCLTLSGCADTYITFMVCLLMFLSKSISFHIQGITRHKHDWEVYLWWGLLTMSTIQSLPTMKKLLVATFS